MSVFIFCSCAFEVDRLDPGLSPYSCANGAINLPDCDKCVEGYDYDGEKCVLGTLPITKLNVSSDGRYLQDQTGKAIFLIGEAAWTLPENATREDVDYYLNDRASKGYNYIQICAARDLSTEDLNSGITSRTMNPTNRYGHKPFEPITGGTKNGKADVSKPISIDGGSPNNPNDYWDHMEYILDKANELNIYVGLLPVWGLYYINHNNESMQLFNVGNAKIYGEFIGKRFSNYQNLIWILGGDTDPERNFDAKAIYRAMAEGIGKGITGENLIYNQSNPHWKNFLMSYHGKPAADSFFNSDAWLSLNMVYDKNPELLFQIQSTYLNTPPRPIIVGESYYEGCRFDGIIVPALTIREQLYKSVLAGSLGGYAHGVAMSDVGKNDQIFRFQQSKNWRDRLNTDGILQIPNIRKILNSHKWELWKPDQSILGSLTGKVASVSRSGSEILVYFPNITSEKIDLSPITSNPRVKATWFNPTSGNSVKGGVFNNSSEQSFIPPLNYQDSVLILQGTNEPLDEPASNIMKFKSIEGEVVLKAENYSYTGGSLCSWSQQTSISDYLDQGYMLSSEENSLLNFNTESCSLNYIIDFKETGTYHVHFRTHAADHTKNGFFATLDNNQVNYGGHNPDDSTKIAYYIFVQFSNKWRWLTDGGGANCRGLNVTFTIDTPGERVFSVYRRDKGSIIDHIWLSKKQKVPLGSNVSTINLPDPSLFIVTED